MLRFRTKRIPFHVLLATMFLACSPLALTHGQVSTNVPVTDDVYRSLDRLIAFGLLEDYLYGLRPFTRVQIARLVMQAKNRLSRKDSFGVELQHSQREDGKVDKITSDIGRSIAALENHFSSETLLMDGEATGEPWELQIFRNFTFDQNYIDSRSRLVPTDIRYGSIDAFINPMFSHRDGRPYVQGANGYLQFQNRLQAFKFLALDFTPYLYLGVPKENARSQREVIIQRLTVKVGFRNLELQVGRDQVIWGQGEMGGVLISNNPKPFDMIKLSTIHPFRLPWYLRYLGPSSGSIFVARLGENRNFPHAALIGISTNMRPLPSFEVGLYHTYLFGGSGAPESDFLDPIAEFFLIRRHGEAFDRPGSPNLADHRAGIQFRFDASALRHTQFYVEWVWDDFLLKILHNSAFLVGIYVPRVDFSGRTGLRLEFRSLARILYRHHGFRTGYAEDGLIIGDPLGPKAIALSLGITREISRHFFFESRLAYEDYRGGNTGTVNFEKTHERRIRTTSALRVRLASGWIVKSTTGYEHVWKFNFEPEKQRDNVLFELGLEFPF
ncbi:MAG: capsule assembly Wzi family protein [Bacteroidota bacterium]